MKNTSDSSAPFFGWSVRQNNHLHWNRMQCEWAIVCLKKEAAVRFEAFLKTTTDGIFVADDNLLAIVALNKQLNLLSPDTK